MLGLPPRPLLPLVAGTLAGINKDDDKQAAKLARGASSRWRERR